MNLVLGGGISGLAALQSLHEKNQKALLLEKAEFTGGLCNGFKVGEFWFDTAVHLSFASGRAKSFFDKTQVIHHTPEPYNFDSGRWLKHPAQNNLFPLSIEEKTEIICGFANNSRTKEDPGNYEDWLRIQYGDSFAEKYPLKYTRKYWRCEANELSVDWVGGRMYQPNLKEVLLGAFSNTTPITYYAKEMRYPEEGQYKTFLKPLQNSDQILTNSEVKEIDIPNKRVVLTSGNEFRYNQIFSSIPLPEMSNITPGMPQSLKIDCNSLEWTTVRLVSIGLNKPCNNLHLWDYYYDEDFCAARSHCPNLKNPNNAPPGCSSVQFEIYANLKKETFGTPQASITNITSFASANNLFSLEDVVFIDVRDVKYANILFRNGMEATRDRIVNWLSQNNIAVIGRFGEWKYLWSDQAYMSGVNAVENILPNLRAERTTSS